MQQFVSCDNCGQKAEVKGYENLKPDPARPGIRVILYIVCPRCGEREQPEKRIE